MKKTKILIIVLSAVLLAPASASRAVGVEKEFATYQEMREQVGKLYQEKKYQEAVVILERGLVRFPDHYYANSYNLALMYGHLKKFKRGIQALNAALKKDMWFGKYAFANEVWAPYKEIKGFKTF